MWLLIWLIRLGCDAQGVASCYGKATTDFESPACFCILDCSIVACRLAVAQRSSAPGTEPFDFPEDTVPIVPNIWLGGKLFIGGSSPQLIFW